MTMAGPKSRSSGSIGSRGCQGPLDVGSGAGQALRSGRVLRSLRRCVCAASEEVRGAIGLRHGVDLRSTGRSLTGSSKCRYRGCGLHMVIAPRAREPNTAPELLCSGPAHQIIAKAIEVLLRLEADQIVS